MTLHHPIRPLQPSDITLALALLPHLADFELPPHRQADDLWHSDAELLKQVAAGQAQASFAEVMVNDKDQPIGLILVTLRAELLSHAPSAHLEAIVVSPECRGQGHGARLLQHAEDKVRSLGAASLTLHVFANNLRARGLYDKSGYDSELIRAIKHLG